MLGDQTTNDATMSPLMSDEEMDPHDQLLLQKRQTSVVTNATQLLDSSPAFYGDQEDERALFNSIGPDGGASRRRAQAAQDDDLADNVPGTAPAGAGAPATMAKPAAGLAAHWKLLLGLGAGAAAVTGLAFLFLRKRARR